ncbi:MAG: glycosyltransferase family 2 protein [Hyphomicrobiales bacterium]
MTSESPLPISVFFIAFNEADRIGRAVAAVKGFASEIVVVDSRSSDATRQIAADLGARVIERDWPGYGPQKRFAEQQCAGPWLLNLDADEVVTAEFEAELRRLFAAGEPPFAAFETPIAEVFPGEAAPHRLAFSLAPVRLYRKDAGRYSESPVHDRVDLAPGTRVGRIAARIHHFSVRSLGEQLAKLNDYSDLQVEDMARRGKTMPAARLLVEFPMAFFKVFFLRRHFLRGWYGIATAANVAFARHLRLAKHVERRRVEALDRKR